MKVLRVKSRENSIEMILTLMRTKRKQKLDMKFVHNSGFSLKTSPQELTGLLLNTLTIKYRRQLINIREIVYLDFQPLIHFML